MIYDPSPRNPQLLHMDSVRGMAERHTLMHNLAQKSLSIYIYNKMSLKKLKCWIIYITASGPFVLSSDLFAGNTDSQCDK